MLFLAHVAEQAQDSNVWMGVITTWGPLILIGVLVYGLFTFKVARKGGLTQVRNRSLEHMDRLEAKTDKMIELLEQIRDNAVK